MVDSVVLIFPLWQSAIDGVFVCINHASWGYMFSDIGLDGLLLDVGQHPKYGKATSGYHTQYRGLVSGGSSPIWLAFDSSSAMTQAPVQETIRQVVSGMKLNSSGARQRGVAA